MLNGRELTGHCIRILNEMVVFQRCYWKNQPVACSAIFETTPTDQGMCCTFNMEKADKMFERSQYSEMITMMQGCRHTTLK